VTPEEREVRKLNDTQLSVEYEELRSNAEAMAGVDGAIRLMESHPWASAVLRELRRRVPALGER
jgi:hypothetical protein